MEIKIKKEEKKKWGKSFMPGVAVGLPSTAVRLDDWEHCKSARYSQCVSFVGYTGGESGSPRLWNL